MRKSIIEHFVVAAKAENLEQIRDFAATYARRNKFSRKEVNRLKVSIDEICSNIVRHAYEGMERGDIQVRIERRKNNPTRKNVQTSREYFETM